MDELHQAGQLLRVQRDVVHNHPDAVLLPRGARQPERLPKNGRDESSSNLHPELMRMEKKLVQEQGF